jgi:CubicO group peptidase (beta-lactamase class C family)
MTMKMTASMMLTLDGVYHSFAVLGILIARLTVRPLGEHLAEDLFDPLGMPDTAFWLS